MKLSMDYIHIMEHLYHSLCEDLCNLAARNVLLEVLFWVLVGPVILQIHLFESAVRTLTVISLLYWVVKYHFVTLLWHLSITILWVIFIWRMAQKIFRL